MFTFTLGITYEKAYCDTDSPKRLQYQIQDTPTTVKESLFSIIYSEKMIY